MTVSTTTSRIVHTGNGVTTAFTAPFKFLQNSDIAVYLDDVQQHSGFTTSGAGGDTGTVTFTTAPAVDVSVALVREQPYTQPTSLAPNGPFPARSVEGIGDRVMLAVQQMIDAVGRTLKFPVSEGTFTDALPTKDDRIGQFLAFDADGNPVASSGTGADAGLRADLATATGAALSGYKQAGASALARTVRDKLRETASIRDEAANTTIANTLGDGSTDCWAAYVAARADSVSGGKYAVRFPYVHGSANVYYFASYDANYFANTKFHVDPGVTLSWPDGSWIGVDTVTWGRPAINIFRSWGNQVWISGKRQLPEVAVDKTLWIDPSDFTRTKYATIVPSATVSLLKTDWGGGTGSDVFSADGTSTAGATGVDFAPGNDGYFHMAMQPVQAGEQINSVFLDPQAANLLLTAMVRTDAGYQMVFVSAADFQSATFVSKVTGVAAASTTFTWLSSGTHANYSAGKSNWAIEIQGNRHWSLKFNGYEILRGRDAGGNILSAGFGVFPLSGGQTLTCDYWVRSINRKPGGKAFTRVALFGDSKTCFRQDNWRLAFMDAMEGAAGVQVQIVGNYAAGGHTSADQLAVMMATDLTGVDHVLIDIGTNDIQGAISTGTFIANIAAMEARAATFGSQCHFAIPYLFYDESLSGSGIATTNYDGGAEYRQILLHHCASSGAGVLDLTELTGEISAFFKNGILSDSGNDTRMLDNIHPTQWLARLLGLEWAKYLAGVLSPQTDMRLTRTLVDSSYAKPGFSFTTLPPVYSRSGDGIVTFTGAVDRGAGSSADGTVAFTLPQVIWPITSIALTGPSDFANCGLTIDSAGNATIFNPGASAFTVLFFNFTYSNKLSF